MKTAKENNRPQGNTKKRKPSLNPPCAEKASASPYMVTASLMLPLACFVIFYVINKTSIIISDTLEPLSPEVSGWQRATIEDELQYNTSLCTIERRDDETLDYEEFERVYR